MNIMRFKFNYCYFIFLCGIITATFNGWVKAQKFEPQVTIHPENPQEGDAVRVGIFVEFFPPCILLPRENSVGETYSVNTNDNNISVNVLSDNLFVCNPIPFSPAPRVFYDLGVLEEGDYTLDTYYTSVSGIPAQSIPPYPLPNIFPVEQYGPQLNFTVRGAPSVPQPVNLFSKGGVVWMFLIMFCLTHSFTRRTNV